MGANYPNDHTHTAPFLADVVGWNNVLLDERLLISNSIAKLSC